ncbi:MAG TPA: hypothetical protein VHE78_06845 [Gemmatimonadaceae bacterium]|nr:hypothetical protein [Gemmatimonadaceae bacterium]
MLATTSADRLPIRHVVLWTVFTAVLVLGLVLYFRDAARVAPLLDAVSGP